MRRLAVIVAAALALACQSHAFVAPVPSSSSRPHLAAQRIKPAYQSLPPSGARSRSISTTRRAAAIDPEAVSTAVTVAAAGAANASPFIAKIANNLSSVAVLAVIIAVHELGHFLAGACLACGCFVWVFACATFVRGLAGH